MLFRIRWKSCHEQDSVELRRGRFQRVLLAAQGARHYRTALEGASLSTLRDVASLGSVEEGLERLPRLEMAVLRARPSATRNRQWPLPDKPRLFYPTRPPRKTALLSAEFREGGGVKVFPEIRRRNLMRFRPDAIAGSVRVLRQLAEPVEDLGAWAPRLTHSVIAFSGPLHGWLTGEARMLFWRVFEAPVFEQLLGLAGELMAWECEAHDGLHIRTEEAVFELVPEGGEPELLMTSLVNLRQPTLRLATGLTASIENSCCACGKPGPRLVCMRSRSLGGSFPPPPKVIGACAAD